MPSLRLLSTYDASRSNRQEFAGEGEGLARSHLWNGNRRGSMQARPAAAAAVAPILSECWSLAVVVDLTTRPDIPIRYHTP